MKKLIVIYQKKFLYIIPGYSESNNLSSERGLKRSYSPVISKAVVLVYGGFSI